MAAEEFAVETAVRVEEIKIDQLYLIELDTPEYGMRLGLGLVTRKAQSPSGSTTSTASCDSSTPAHETTREVAPRWTVGWFRFKKQSQGWKAKNPVFERHKKGGKWEEDDLEMSSFRLLVEDHDLTKQGLTEKLTAPKFTQDFAAKVKGFAQNQDLSVEESEAEAESLHSDEEGGEEGEGSEGGDEDNPEGSSASEDGEVAPAAPQEGSSAGDSSEEEAVDRREPPKPSKRRAAAGRNAGDSSEKEAVDKRKPATKSKPPKPRSCSSTAKRWGQERTARSHCRPKT